MKKILYVLTILMSYFCVGITNMMAKEVTITDYRFFQDNDSTKPYWWLEHSVSWEGVDAKYRYTRTRAGIFKTSENEIVYCIQPGIKMASATNGMHYYTYNEVEDILKYSGLSKQLKESLELISYFGYGYDGDKSEAMYVATQLTIWNTVKPNSTKILDGEKKASEVKEKQNVIQKRIEDYQKKISFEDKTVELMLGKEEVIEDKNAVLSHYDVLKCENCQAKIEENKLFITPLAKGKGAIILTRKIDNDKSHSILYASGNYQKMMSFKDPVAKEARMSFNVDDVEVKFYKRDKETGDSSKVEKSFEGAEYGIYNVQGELLETLKADKSGYMETHLGYGTYIVKELKAPVGYAKSEEEYILKITEENLKEGICLEVFDIVIKGNVTIQKQEAGTKQTLEGADICLYDKEDQLLSCATTDKDGNATFKDIPYGKYYYQEKNAPLGYSKDNTKYFFEIQEQKNYFFTIENKKIEIIPPETGDEIQIFVFLSLAGFLCIFLSHSFHKIW